MPDRFVALAFVVLFSTPSLLAGGEPACHEPRNRSPIAGESIGLVYGPEIDRGTVEEAIAVWRSCPNSRDDFPSLVHGESTATIYVELRSGTSGGRRCGLFRGRTITLYRWARASDHSVRSCGSLALNLAHELGHVLGLADSREDSRCESTIMADLEPGNLFRRSIAEEECRLAGERWSTLTEIARAAGAGDSDLPFGRPTDPRPTPADRTARPRR